MSLKLSADTQKDFQNLSFKAPEGVSLRLDNGTTVTPGAPSIKNTFTPS